MRRLTKADSREPWDQAREMWNEWDPIGVMDDPACPRDEYDAYVAPTLRMLWEAPSESELAKFLSSLVQENMGLPGSSAGAFARKLIEWRETHWADTRL